MSKVGGVVRLPYGAELSTAGAMQVCRQWLRLGPRPDQLDFNALRALAAQAAAEIALIRHLSSNAIPHVVEASSATRWPCSALRLGGRPVFVHSQLTERAGRPLRSNPVLLEDGQAAEGVHLFVLVRGRVTKGPRELVAGQPHFLLHPLPAAWGRPSPWRPLGELAFKLEVGEDVELEIAGLLGDRSLHQARLELRAGERVSLPTDFYALAYLRTGKLPVGRLGVSSPAAGLRHIATPKDWGNLFVYGEGIDLLGYLSGHELLGRGRRAALRPERLRSLADLFARAHEWSSRY